MASRSSPTSLTSLGVSRIVGDSSGGGGVLADPFSVTAAAGRRYLSPPLSQEALVACPPQPEGNTAEPYNSLSSREREVLQMTVEGHSGVEIAELLFISPRTVETHRANLMRKLGVRNQKELVRYAMQRGILVK